MIHLASFGILFRRMLQARSVEGLSLKTQELYLLVFMTRYLDLFNFARVDFLHVYNFCMKIVYLSASATIVYYIRRKQPWKATYKPGEDSFLHVQYAIAPCAVLALLVHSEFSFMEVLWTFSIYLEAIAIMPQLILMQRYGNIENLTANYVFCLGAYRGLYVLNWVWRYAMDTHYHVSKVSWIVWISGLIQTALYCDFFYYYAMSKWYNKTMLPK